MAGRGTCRDRPSAFPRPGRRPGRADQDHNAAHRGGGNSVDLASAGVQAPQMVTVVDRTQACPAVEPAEQYRRPSVHLNTGDADQAAAMPFNLPPGCVVDVQTTAVGPRPVVTATGRPSSQAVHLSHAVNSVIRQH
jgi:hypothetical protein